MKDMAIAIFEGRRIRKASYGDAWWFVMKDVIEALTDSRDPSQYFKKLRKRDRELSRLMKQGGTHLVPLLMLEIETAGGRQKAYCWNTEGIFRLIQSISSPKAEAFKRWLVKAGKSGGSVAGRTRKDIESKSGKKVVTKKNYLGVEQKVIKKR